MIIRQLFIITVLLLNQPEPGRAKDCISAKNIGYECNDAKPKMHFYYDIRTELCQPFIFRGCGGNANRFHDMTDCQKSCSDSKQIVKKTQKKNNTYASLCNITFSDLSKDVPWKCENGKCPKTHFCHKGFCCPTKEYICSMDEDTGFEESWKHRGRYTYMKKINDCEKFSYSGSGGNFNNFETYFECKTFCSL